jgi:hypothetical protein
MGYESGMKGRAISLWAGFTLHLPYPKMLQDLFADSFIFNKGDDSHRSLALGTSKWINLVNILNQP